MARLQKKNAGGSHHRFGWDIPALPARWAYDLYAVSPVSGLLATVARGRCRAPARELDASIGTSGPCDFTVLPVTFVRARLQRAARRQATASRPQRS